LSSFVGCGYVNRKRRKVGFHTVEIPCGKVCGECGKVRVLNRLVGVLNNCESRKTCRNISEKCGKFRKTAVNYVAAFIGNFSADF